MNAQRQVRKRRPEDEPTYIVGMDAHSKKLAISIWDWSDRWNPVAAKEIRCFDIAALEATYKRHVDLDSLTVIESSTNSMALRRRLNSLGFRAEVVRADAIADKERKRKVCDLQDARNLARAYIKGDVDEFVWAPSDRYSEYRDMMFAYRDAAKEVTRMSNRIWSLCSRKGYGLPIRGGSGKAEAIRAETEGLGLSGFARVQLDHLLADYERMVARKSEIAKMIAEVVVKTPRMLRLMQLPGVNYRGAFALEAAVEDIGRFQKASKLAAYGGFSPILDTSGDEEESARRRGGPGKPLDGEGREDIKFFFAEAGQAVLTSCGKMDIGAWGWRMVNRGKPRNKVVCAIGRKLLTYAWHIMRGDPTPNRLNEAFFRRKMKKLHETLSSARMRELGFGTQNEFASQQAELVYGGLPPLATPAGSSSGCGDPA
jgi:transposase